MNRRDFIGGCLGCYLSFALTGCTSTPVTNRKQLSIYPDSVINRQASLMYKRMIQRSKLSDDKDQLKTISDNLLAERGGKGATKKLAYIIFDSIKKLC